MDVHITLDGGGPPLSTQVYRGLVDPILDGRLRPGQRLPSTRALAGDLSVARTTVVYAYERLTAEGFLVSRVGAGTFVGDDHPRPGPRDPHRANGDHIQLAPFWRHDRGVPPSVQQDHPVEHDFTAGIPDARLFPIRTWRRLVTQALDLSPAEAGRYGDPAGTEDLRAAIARHVAIARSVRCGPEEVMVTRGAQQAFDVLGRILLGPGSRVAVEEPGYPPVRRLFESLGADVVGVPVTDAGIDVAAIPDGTRVVCVTPSHQFPLGTTMPLPTRTALLAWAEVHDAVVIEDDYDSEFRFTDRPLAPLHHLDRSGRVIYVASFSKSMLPSLRLGFIVAPMALIPALREAKALTDSHSDPVIQHALARFIDEGELMHHVRRARRAYARRHALIAQALADELSPWLVAMPSIVGLHISARLRPDVDIDLREVTDEAHRRGVRVDTLEQYCSDQPAQAGLVLGYGGVQTQAIPTGLGILRQCLEGA